MNKKAFRAESGLDAGVNNVINVLEPRAGQPNDAVNVSYFIKKNTVQPFDSTRNYEQFFAVTHERRLWVAKVAISAGPFNIDQWESLRTDPSWQVVTGTGGTPTGKDLQSGDYITAYSVNSELVFTLPRTPSFGDTIVIQDEGMYCHMMSIRVLAPTRPFEDGTGTDIFTIPGSMKTYVYSSTGGGRWIVHTSVDKVNAKIISRTAQPNQAAAGDMLYRKTSTGHITVQLPKYAVDGDVVSTSDLDGLNPVNGSTVQVHPDSGHSVDRAGVNTVSSNTTGTGSFIFKDNLWNVWDGDIRSRWQPIKNNTSAAPFDQLAIIGYPSNKTVEITLPKDASDGDYVRVANRYVLDGLVTKIKVDASTAHKIVGSAAMFEIPKYKDLPKDWSASIPQSTEITFSNKSLGSVIELFFDSASNLWIVGEATIRVEHVDETNRDRPGVAPLASQDEVNKNHEQNPRDDMIVTPKTLANSVATETRRGIARIATNAEVMVNTGTPHSNEVIVTPGRLNERFATEERRGVAEIATQSEANTTGNDTHIVTPKKLDGRRATNLMSGVVKIMNTGGTASTSRGSPGSGVYNWDISVHNEPYVVTPRHLNECQATETSRGVAYIGTQSEVNAQGSSAVDNVIITPKKLDARRATDAMAGIAEIATQAETNTGTDYIRIVTPKTLNDRRATESLHGLAEIATQAEVDAGTDTTRFITPVKFKTWMGYDHFTSTTSTGIEHTGNLWGKVTLKIRPATETQIGTLRVATQTEANGQGAAALDTVMITPKKLDARRASQDIYGVIAVAYQDEVNGEGTDAKAVSPKKLGVYIHTSDAATANESRNGTARMASLAETWVGNDTAGSTKPEADYPHSPKVVSPRTLNYALKNYLPKNAKAVDSDKLDNLDSSQFLRRDVDQTMLGKITFTNDTVLEWSRNTDGACIGFKSDGDSDVDSYMYFRTFDNGNEYFRWDMRGAASSGSVLTELMTLKPDHLRFKGNAVYHTAHKPSANDVGAYSKSEADSRFVNVTGDSMSGTLNSNGITSATVYSFERIPTYESGSKTYLRKFRGGLNDTIWHETVRHGIYQLSTGSTDSYSQLEISNSALSVTNGYKIGGTTVIESDAKIHWNKLKGIPSASVSAQGIVQLNDSLNSTSTTQAATPNAVRVLKELIDSKAGIVGAVMDDLKIKNWIRIGNVILRPNPVNKTLDFIWSDEPM